MAIVLILFILIAILLIRNIRVVPQASVYVIERFGVYNATWQAGLHVKLPFVDNIVRKISLKEQLSDFEPSNVITQDNVTVQIDSVVYWKVFDAEKFTYGVERPIAAIENLTMTTMRQIMGTMTLDQSLTSREAINAKLTTVLDEATDEWGIKVNRIEIKNITPPRSIQDAMEKQMKAEREKRAVILQAEGEKQAAITAAEGEKESAILRADAIKEQRIREAEGEAQAILAVKKAQAEAIRLISDADPSQKYLQLRSLEAAEKMADGKATKLVVPSDLQGLASTMSAVKEFVGNGKQ